MLTSPCVVLSQATLEGRLLPPAVGALLFSCNGRGQDLYGTPHVDSRTLAKYLPVPFGGFMCNGRAANADYPVHIVYLTPRIFCRTILI